MSGILKKKGFYSPFYFLKFKEILRKLKDFLDQNDSQNWSKSGPKVVQTYFFLRKF